MSNQKSVLRDMMANAVHFGHLAAKWNPKMAPYLHGKKNNVHIFDLNQTYVGLEAAKEFLKAVSSQNKTILLVSTKQQSIRKLQETAEKCGMPFVNSKWIPGLLTNFKTIKARVTHMKKLEEDEQSGGFEKYTKKEALKFKKEIVKLEAALGGVKNMEKLPEVIFILDAARDKIAVKEAQKMGITIVAVVDSNADPTGIKYPIPGNDDAIKSIQFFLSHIESAILEGAGKSK